MRNKVLMIEDDSGLAAPLKDYFEDHGLKVYWAATGTEALALYSQHTPDIIMLDIILPDHNGFELLDIIRDKDDTPPIILITGTEYNDTNQVRAYTSGSVNFMPKPIVPQAVLALIQQLLKLPADIRKYRLGQYEITIQAQSVMINGKQFTLREKDSALFTFLLDRKKQIVSREALLKHIWGDDSYENNKLLDSAVYRIKNVLKYYPDIKIKSVYAVGYILQTAA